MRKGLITYTDAARELGTDIRTISGLVKALGISPKPTGLPGKSKGLDADDMAIIRKALTPPRRSRRREPACPAAC